MMNTQNNENSKDEILAEILLKPSDELKTDRFKSEAEAAGCNGMCHSGACRGVV